MFPFFWSWPTKAVATTTATTTTTTTTTTATTTVTQLGGKVVETHLCWMDGTIKRVGPSLGCSESSNGWVSNPGGFEKEERKAKPNSISGQPNRTETR